MFVRMVRYFFPNIEDHEIPKFTLLAMTFFLIIGTYWLLRLLKYTIFMKVAFPEELGWVVQQGRLFQPTAKFWSPFFVLAMVLIYSKLVDLFKKHQLFYYLFVLSIVFAGLAAGLFYKDYYGLHCIGCYPLAAIGWISYFAVESFGSLVPALFWSFTNSVSDSESAKHGFPFIISMAQIGAVVGSGTLFFSDKIGALWPILVLASILVAAVIPMIRYFVKIVPPQELVGYKAAAVTETRKEGFFEGFISGFTLLVTRRYLLGILVVSTFYEAVSQIVEYQMQSQASMSPAYASDLAFAKFMATYGIAINVASFLLALLGTSYIIRRFGTRKSLLIYPVAFAITLLVLFCYFYFWSPSTTALMWATFGSMVVIKSMGYAVNNPTKEMMYIPTSKDAKFKSKGWIDTFGSRFAKAGGAQVSNAFKHTLQDLMFFGTFFGFGLIGLWFFVALYVGKKNAQLIRDNEVVE